MLFHRHAQPYDKLRALVNSHWARGTTSCDGFNVPRSLPGDLQGNPSHALLLSALAIELALFGTSQPLPFARHVNDLILACCSDIGGFTTFFHRPSGRERKSLFARAARRSAVDAGGYSLDYLSCRIRESATRGKERSHHAALKRSTRARSDEIRARQKATEAHHYCEQKLRRLRAANTSKLLWTRHNAAIAIQVWLRRRRHRRFFSEQRQKRLRLCALCRGASAQASQLLHRLTPPVTDKKIFFYFYFFESSYLSEIV